MNGRRYNISYKDVFARLMIISMKIRLLQRVAEGKEIAGNSYPPSAILIFRFQNYNSTPVFKMLLIPFKLLFLYQSTS